MGIDEKVTGYVEPEYYHGGPANIYTNILSGKAVSLKRQQENKLPYVDINMEALNIALDRFVALLTTFIATHPEMSESYLAKCKQHLTLAQQVDRQSIPAFVQLFAEMEELKKTFS